MLDQALAYAVAHVGVPAVEKRGEGGYVDGGLLVGHGAHCASKRGQRGMVRGAWLRARDQGRAKKFGGIQ